MSNAEIQSQIVAFIILLIPIVAALWKVFSLLQGIEARLEDSIQAVDRRVSEIDHQGQLRQVQMDALNDRLLLGINGTKELTNHLRSRTKVDTDQLLARIAQVERYLNKTTDFQSRDQK